MSQIHTTELKTTPSSSNDRYSVRIRRSDVLLRRWRVVLLIAIIAAAATYIISKAVPAEYSTSGTVAVSVTGGTDPNETANAENSFASQYAQDVTGQTVIAAAKRKLNSHDAAGLSGAISGGTLNAQNIVQVTAIGSSPGQAQRRAAAVVSALTVYVAQSISHERAAYSHAVDAQLAPIDSQIRGITNQISSAPVSALNTGRYLALQQTLSTLIAQRSSSYAAVAQSATATAPSLSLLSAPSPGSQTVPRPTLYAAVAFVLALILASQAVILLTPRRD
jgi:capsular polysaccharide biosynthesis protein